MPVALRVLLWIEAAFATTAALSQLWHIRFSTPVFRGLRSARFVVASTYSILFVMMATDSIDSQSFTNATQGLGLVAWWVAWILPVILERRLVGRLNWVINREAEKIALVLDGPKRDEGDDDQ